MQPQRQIILPAMRRFFMLSERAQAIAPPPGGKLERLIFPLVIGQFVGDEFAGSIGCDSPIEAGLR